MARLSDAHYHDSGTPKPPASAKKRFSDIFKSSPRSSPGRKEIVLDRGVEKVGLFPVNKNGRFNANESRQDDASRENLRSPSAESEAKSEDIKIPNEVDKTMDPSGATNAQDLVGQWQAELHEQNGKARREAEASAKHQADLAQSERKDRLAVTKLMGGREIHVGPAEEVRQVRQRDAARANEGILAPFVKHLDDIEDPASSLYPKGGQSASHEDRGGVQGNYINDAGHTAHDEHVVDRSNFVLEDPIMHTGGIVQDFKTLKMNPIKEDIGQEEEDDVSVVQDPITAVDHDLSDHSSIVSEQSAPESSHDNEFFRELYRTGMPTVEGVQYYVNRKVQEVLDEHEDKYHHLSHVRRHYNTAPMDIKVGPVYIVDPVTASFSQHLMFSIYLSMLFFAALKGPKEFVVWVWRMAVILGTYEIYTRKMGWKDEQKPDVLLVPAYYALEELVKVGEDTVLRVGFLLESIASGTSQNALDTDEEEDTE
ncbi:hypothetical protein K505DRAFT_361182 [Melanomma pulvis-pyrius CBS 109.77]|uniref:Uncharacterized protein n=1 Tax=Melanomma pulvis-pyrius CBS 109.77 TaxID=1314802 RepID=A0A6A6XDC3_9PLEO|nr:hypothetical protein K505DRAFT_361182 [Melanomma pulvis-pyrius CBS 109.77]